MSLRIGMVHWNLPEEGKKAWGVGVCSWTCQCTSPSRKFCTLLFSQPQAKGCYLWSYKSDSINKLESVNRRLVLPFQIVFFELRRIRHITFAWRWLGILNRSIPTVRTFHGCSNEAKFADNLKAKLVHSVYHPLELWASKLAVFL